MATKNELLAKLGKAQQLLEEIKKDVKTMGRWGGVTTEQVLADVEAGMKVKEIAKKYNLSERTVYNKIKFRIKL